MTPFGYYPRALAGGIDRVLGFDIGRKKLPALNDEMTDQRRILCRYCGEFRTCARVRHIKVNKEIISSAWVKVYNRYKKKNRLCRYIS